MDLFGPKVRLRCLKVIQSVHAWDENIEISENVIFLSTVVCNNGGSSQEIIGRTGLVHGVMKSPHHEYLVFPVPTQTDEDSNLQFVVRHEQLHQPEEANCYLWY